MPVVAHSLAPPQRSPRAVLILILVFFKKPIGRWELIVDVTHLFFSNMLLLRLVLILGPFARIGLFSLIVTAAYGSHHVNLEHKILALRFKI